MNTELVSRLRGFIVVFFIFFIVAGVLAESVFAAADNKALSLRVVRVVDGDTIWTEGGEKVRYIGIDTPERGEPFYEQARLKNLELVGGRLVEVVVCKDEPRDRYGRLLAWIYADGVDVAEEILRAGLARRLMIPPCGRINAGRYRAVERDARRRGVGLWGAGKKKTPEED
ncbi:hypothetical protein MNBD_DELTA02-371 [hydrothermal vent metagenome]|uniref:TNase-like domain-containing protein n=1 Tax=hydrothermal vent metagenome TaxID=652676 RepID=A0A3B0V651_9ZZZZ